MLRYLFIQIEVKSFLILSFLILISSTKICGKELVIKGRITDLENNPVVFASVALENGIKGATTNENGIFELQVFNTDSVKLNISSIGYDPKQITVSPSKSTIAIQLTARVNDIDEVTVKGKSMVQQINESAYNVVAIDAKALHNTTDNLASALSTVPGIRLRESGGVGSNMRITLDGFTGQQIKIFIDGVPQGGVGRSFGLSNIPINYAERIEVYRGVVPVGFGSDALGGVINIVTNSKQKSFIDAAYAYGSFNTHKTYVNVGHTLKSGLMFEINAFQNYSDNSYYIDTPVKDFETGVWDSSKPEHVQRFHDTYHNEAVTGKVGFVGKKFADRLMLGLAYSQSDKEIQNGVQQVIVYGQKRRKDQSIMPSLEYRKKNLFVNSLDVTFTANLNINEFHNIDTSAYEYNWRGESRYAGNLGEQTYQDSKFEDKNMNSTITMNYAPFRGHTFVFNHVYTGFKRESVSQPDPELSNVSGATLMDKVSRKNISGLSYAYNFNDVWNISVFGKYYNQYGSGPVNVATGNSTEYAEGSSQVDIFGYGVAGTYFFMDGFQLKLSAEKAVRLPSADQLFGDEDLELGATNLEPEKSDNLNASLSFTHEFGKHAVYAEGGLIYRNTRDYIRRTTENLGGGLKAASQMNHGRVVTKGVNTNIRYSWSRVFSLGGNFSYLDIRNQEQYVAAGSLQESTTKNARIPNKPYLFSNMNASWYVHNFLGKENVLTLMYDNAYVHEFPLHYQIHGRSNKSNVPDQFSHNIRAMYSMKSGKYNFSLECKNVTDEKMYDNFSLQKAGRAFYGKIRYYFTK